MPNLLNSEKRIQRNMEESLTKKTYTTLHEAVPAMPNQPYETLTFHSHKIIIAKQSKIYKTIMALEGLFLVSASVFMMSLSGATVVYAYAMLAAQS